MLCTWFASNFSSDNYFTQVKNYWKFNQRLPLIVTSYCLDNSKPSPRWKPHIIYSYGVFWSTLDGWTLKPMSQIPSDYCQEDLHLLCLSFSSILCSKLNIVVNYFLVTMLISNWIRSCHLMISHFFFVTKERYLTSTSNKYLDFSALISIWIVSHSLLLDVYLLVAFAVNFLIY